MLSKRLTTIGNLVDENKVVYDVGTDHALLPCFLIEERHCKKVYACDNKEGPLLAAKENINKRNLQEKIITILSNGIDDIKEDVNIITIAGMGVYTALDILKGHDLSKYDKLIIQVNKEMNELRKWISNNHFTIIDEKVVLEDKYYEIVVFNTERSSELTDLEIEYGPINLKNREDVFNDYLKYKLDKNISIYQMFQNDELKKRIDILNSLIKQ